MFSSKLDTAKKFTKWVTSDVLPSIRKYGSYHLFRNPNNYCLKIDNETDFHYQVVAYIKRYCTQALIIPGLGENQDSAEKRIDSYKNGYQRGQPDLIISKYQK